MLKEKQKEIRTFLKNSGAVTESHLWSYFTSTDDILQRHEISSFLYKLEEKGIIDMRRIDETNVAIWKNKVVM